MPTEKGDKRSVTIWIEKETVSRLDALAEKGDITRNKLVINILEVEIDQLKKFKKIGFFAIALIIRYFKEKISPPR